METRYSSVLNQKLRAQPWKGLLAITRGGLAPAAVLSRELDIVHVGTVCMVSYDGKAQGELNLLKGVELENGGDGWLVIDDLVDTGKTIRMIRELLPEAHVAAIYAKPAGKDPADTYLTEAGQETWVFFSWE